MTGSHSFHTFLNLPLHPCFGSCCCVLGGKWGCRNVEMTHGSSVNQPFPAVADHWCGLFTLTLFTVCVAGCYRAEEVAHSPPLFFPPPLSFHVRICKDGVPLAAMCHGSVQERGAAFKPCSRSFHQLARLQPEEGELIRKMSLCCEKLQLC